MWKSAYTDDDDNLLIDFLTGSTNLLIRSTGHSIPMVKLLLNYNIIKSQIENL